MNRKRAGRSAAAAYKIKVTNRKRAQNNSFTVRAGNREEWAGAFSPPRARSTLCQCLNVCLNVCTLSDGKALPMGRPDCLNVWESRKVTPIGRPDCLNVCEPASRRSLLQSSALARFSRAAILFCPLSEWRRNIFQASSKFIYIQVIIIPIYHYYCFE